MKQPVIIIGMHRSGTSMLTRILQEAGLFMGDKREENDEALFFLEFNTWILKQTNSNWDCPYCYQFSNTKFKKHIIEAYKRRSKSIFTLKYLGLKKYLKYRSLENIDFAWGWKDPRNSITLDIWKSIYPNAKILHIYRNPIDVAQSLKVRTIKSEIKFKETMKTKIRELFLKQNIGYIDSCVTSHLAEGYNLWTKYVSQSLKEERALHISYEKLLTNPEKYLNEIFNFLNIKVSDEQINVFSTKFVKNRKYAFLQDKELLNFYHEVRNDDLMKKLNYSNIDG